MRAREQRSQTGRRSSHLMRRERQVQQPEKVLVFFFLLPVGVRLEVAMLGSNMSTVSMVGRGRDCDAVRSWMRVRLDVSDIPLENDRRHAPLGSLWHSSSVLAPSINCSRHGADHMHLIGAKENPHPGRGRACNATAPEASASSGSGQPTGPTLLANKGNPTLLPLN